jgi:two-component system chemotaxis sensor kinase CheA
MDIDRFRALYAEEASDQLRLLAESVLALEQGGDDARQALAAAFRSAHTLKGMAASMGYDVVAERAHALEDRLHDVRSGVVSVDAVLVDNLLAMVDGVRRAALEPTPADAPGPAVPGADAFGWKRTRP